MSEEEETLEENIDELLENDEINNVEQGFMFGEEDAEEYENGDKDEDIE